MVGGSRSHPPSGQEPYRHEFTSTAIPDNSDPQRTLTSTWTIPWGDLISGGDLTVRATVNFSINNRMTQAVTVGHELKVVGKNEALTTQIKTITGTSLETLAVAWQESHHFQFDNKGFPRLGGGDGWGIMQLDNIPGVTLTEPHFWDWRANVREGMKYLKETLYADSLSWLKFQYDIDDESDEERTSGKDHLWGWSPYEIDSDDTVAPRIWNDVLSQYNTGTRLYSPDGANGMEDFGASKGDRTYDNDRFDGCDYKDIIRCHMENKSWEKDQAVDEMCRKIYEDDDES